MTVVPAIIQFALAITFVVLPVVGWRCGPAAQRAAEDNLARQGAPAGLLDRHGVNFGAGPASVVLAASIALCLAVLGVLGLLGSAVVVALVFQAVLLVLGLVIMPGEVFTTRYLQAAFRRSGEAGGVDVQSFVAAAQRAYPSWTRAMLITRFALATLGSAVVLVLLFLRLG